MEYKLKKHLDFCKKYPETIVGYQHGVNVSYYLEKGTPQIDYFKVFELSNMSIKNPNFFSKYKTIKKDWNDLVTTKGG